MESPNTPQNEKMIFEYDDYRKYLQEVYHAIKSRDKKFSFRYFARVAGFKSPSFLKLVMDGKSNLSAESIEKFSQALKHNKTEAQFFYNLVHLNQATTSEEKKLYAEAILSSRAYRKVHPLSEPLYHYLSQWYFIVIKEMVDMADFKEDLQWISKKLRNSVTPTEIKRAIDEMLQLGILGRDPKGQLYQIKTFIMSADEVVLSSAAAYHREMMKKASDSIDLVPRPKRELSALTLSVSKNTATKIKNMIQQFRKDIMEVCTEETNPDSVYQVNLHLFPLVESDQGES